MRTTVKLDNDVARAVEDLRREEGLGVSAALNTLARRGLATQSEKRSRFVQTVSPMGESRIPLDDIGAALEVLEGEAHSG
jgi:predicted ATPase